MSNAVSLNIALVIFLLFVLGLVLLFRWADKTPLKDPRKPPLRTSNRCLRPTIQEEENE